MESSLVISKELSEILAAMEREPEHTETPVDEWVTVPPERVDPMGPRVLSRQRARLWTLVLDSRYIECRMVPSLGGWQLQVHAAALQAACRELQLFVEENRNWPPPLPPPRPMIENTIPTICVLLLLATFHNITGLDVEVLGRQPQWVEIGCAQGAAILRGELWRTVTALTLHADWVHLLGNITIGGVFVVYLCRDLGSGLAWSLILASGALGNLMNAYIQLPSHSSVGSSTAVFGAVGIMGAVSMVRYRHHLRRRWPLPIAAALALLVLLGTEGKNTDLGAHLFGFVFGCGLGFLAEFLLGYLGRPRGLVNALLAMASSGVVVAAWWWAIMFGD